MIGQQSGRVGLEESVPELTPCEQLILEYIWRGYSTGMIAGVLRRSIEAYRQGMFKKFHVTNTMQMIRAALRNQLLKIIRMVTPLKDPVRYTLRGYFARRTNCNSSPFRNSLRMFR